MAQSEERILIKTEVEIAQSMTRIQQLTLANKNLNNEIEQMGKKTKANKADRDKLNAQIAENNKLLKEQYQSLGTSGMSMNELKGNVARLVREYKNLRPAAADYAKEEERIRKEILDTNKALTERSDKIKNTKSALDSVKPSMDMGSVVDGVIGGVTSKIAQLAILEKGIEAITAAIGKSYEKQRELSKATGATAARLGLETNSVALKELSNTATQMGDAFNKATPAVLESIQEIGSIRPELMQNSKALTLVTEDAMLLAGADGLLSVADAGIAVAGSLNQFNESADQSHRYANVLAASAKEGSATINQVAESFKASGTVLAENNISFEQGNALVQVLAKKMILGGEAGTALRNIFMTLTAQTNQNLNPAIVGLGTSLDNLSKLSPQELIKLFGKENEVAALTVIKNRTEVERLTHAVSGTNEVVSQFHKQMDTLDQDAESFSHVWDGIFEDFGKKYEGLFRKITRLGVETLNYLRYFNLNLDTMTVTGYGDVKARKKIEEEYKKQAQTAQADARKVVSEYEKAGGKNEPLLAKQLKGLKSVVSQSQAGINEVMDRYLKARRNNADAETIQNILNEKKYFEEKYKFARIEEQRLQKNERQRIQTQKELKEGSEKADDKKGKSSPEANKAASLLQKRIENHIKANETIAKNNADLIENEDLRKRTQLQNDYDHEMNALRKQLKDKEITIEDFNALSASQKKKFDNGILKIDKETKDKETKANTEKLKKESQAALESAKMVAEARLQSAELFGTDEEILENKLAVNIVEEKLAIFNAGELDHNAIHAKYAAQRAKITIDAVKTGEKEKDKLIKGYEDAREKDDERQIKERQDREKKKEEDLADVKRNFAQVTSQEIENTVFNFLRSGIDSELSAEDRKYQRLVQLNDQRLANNEISQAEHDAKSLQLQEKHDAKVRELKRRQAIFDKAKAILDIGISTAVNVAKASLTPWLIPWIVGTGLVQAASIAAQPIPEFEQGIEDTGDGKKYPQANDGKGGFWAMLHPNEGVVPSEELPAYKAFKRLWSGNMATPNLRTPNVQPLVIQMQKNQSGVYERANSFGNNTFQTANNTNIPPEVVMVLNNAVTVINELREQLKVPVPVKLSIGHKTAEDILDTANEAKEIKTKSSAISAS